MPEGLDPYHRWLGIRPEEQPPSHYRLLVIQEFEETADVIAHAADARMAHLKTHQAGEHAALSQELLNEVAAARVCLLNREKKARYDEPLRKKRGTSQRKAAALPVAKPLAATSKSESQEARPPGEIAADRPADASAKRGVVLAVGGGAMAGLAILGLVLWAFSSPDKPATVDRRQAAPVEPRESPPQPPPAEPSELPDEPSESPDATAPEDGPTEHVAVPPQPDEPAPVEPTPAAEPTDPAPVEPSPAEPMVEPSDPRRPVPEKEAQAKVVEQLEEVFELGKQRTPEETHKLARQLYDLGRQAVDDPTERFVLLRKAMELAATAGDAASVQAVVDVIAEDFQIDALDVKLKVLGKFAAKAGTTQRIESLVFGAGVAIDQAMEQERYDVAMKLADAVYRVCSRPAGIKFRKEMGERRAGIKEAYDRWLPAHQAQLTLKDRPDDPPSNLAMGLWLCFDRNDWTKGLAHLAKGSDAELAALAARDADSPPRETAARMALADAWWDLAETRKESQQRALQRRVGHWYRQARAGVSGGLMKIKIDKRLGEIAQIAGPPPSHLASTERPRPHPGKSDPGSGFVPHFPDPVKLMPPSNLAESIPGLAPGDTEPKPVVPPGGRPRPTFPGAIDLLRLFDPRKAAAVGNWQFDGSVLVSPGDKSARLQFDYVPPAEYEVTVEVVRSERYKVGKQPSGHGAFVMGLCGQDHQFILGLDWNRHGHGQHAYLAAIRDEEGRTNPRMRQISPKSPRLPPGKPCKLVYTVRKTGVSVALYDRGLYGWKGDLRRSVLPQDWAVPDPSRLFVGSRHCSFRIVRLEVKPLPPSP